MPDRSVEQIKESGLKAIKTAAMTVWIKTHIYCIALTSSLLSVSLASPVPP